MLSGMPVVAIEQLYGEIDQEYNLALLMQVLRRDVDGIGCICVCVCVRVAFQQQSLFI